MRIRLRPSEDSSAWLIDDASLGFGGMAPTTIIAKKASQFLPGKVLCEETIKQATDMLLDEVKLPDDVPGGQSQYRAALAGSFLRRAYMKMCVELKALVDASIDQVGLVVAAPCVVLIDLGILLFMRQHLPAAPAVEDSELSAADGFLTLPKPESRGEQTYFQREGGLQKTTPSAHTPDGDGRTKRAPVGEPIAHKSADMQVRYND